MSNEVMRKYAVIDLEATNAGVTAAIIQVGIVIIEGKEIVETYQTDINPHEPLSDHIKTLTGITDDQLAKAPDFSQVAKTIYELISDCVFVAHNVKFDANLLAEALFLEGYDLLTPRVDTVELAQIFFPHLEKYNLSYLSKQLGLDLEEAHTAVADAKATAALFIKLLHKIESLPSDCLESLLTYADSLLFETAMVIEQGLAKAKPYNPNKYVKIRQILLPKTPKAPKPYQLSKSFPINMALLGLEERPKQAQFAQLIDEDYHQGVPSFIEAQTGIGKTYGYLLPLLAKEEQNQIIVSVPTKLLQDQLMASEVAAIQEQFHIACHSLKGPANYLKLDTFADSLDQNDQNRLVNRYKMQLLVWLLETKTGDLGEIKQKQRFAAYFDQIKHDGALNVSSDFYDYDFWKSSYEKAKTVRLLITNHAYFLHRVQDDKDFARNKVLVFDEAQKLMLQLDQLSRHQLNLTVLLQTIQAKLSSPLPLLEKRLLESLSFELGQVSSDYYQNRKHQLAPDWSRIAGYIKELRGPDYQDLQAFFAATDGDYWLSSEKQEEKRITYLNSASKEFIHFQSFLPETVKTYFVSATIHISPEVGLADLLGFKSYSYHLIEADKKEEQLLMIDQDMPLITGINEQIYTKAVAKRIDLLRQEDKPILVLFTAKKYLMMVSDYLEQWQVPHLAQEKNGTAYNIKKRFDRGEQSILLGLGSFWEGVDFVEADRMITLITRLPFDNPEDLFVKKMSRFLLNKGKNPFKDYFLPMAILRLKQAIGRTMRRQSQKSVVLMLDRRLLTKSYGQTILESLDQEFVISQQNFQDSLVEMARFLL
ncbi:UNVERIFIED_CONTAM: bifunctional DnaQ family exonuclease/ATP-dependent helicase [Streptococcus canis]|uniref:bifunctional DnaQ family exonuclease/ATP-dependent helicase n=1 Tax=Streptococcus canis TaxID=1329 RepID=UPI000B8B7638|nr:bifunctional DnaQ family exonuclease/ATP-dependent helicase [Streptococcus canis]QJD13302.1 bifunctional DnaQ family exonuclease/ATP-dependent helicase [Streptococcus canis]VTR79571.1 helicase DinG [Streptococcus canis]GFG47445.1 putative ATP-dependent DNA helicase [Streptococcus canis]GMX36538.1 bifunctional DnaQ family exonuclease/ATP-dependent helicase [Streptococcus canis]GMX39954.1 bifunctional DnaQ family exonuclease/ATP-dependent helicase [Streptococcus canis]